MLLHSHQELYCTSYFICAKSFRFRPIQRRHTRTFTLLWFFLVWFVAHDATRTCCQALALLHSIVLLYIYTFLYGKFSFGRGWESEWEWIIMEKFFFLFSQWGPSHSYLPSTSLKHFYNDIWDSHNISRKSLGFSTCYILFIFSAESSLIRHTFQLVTLISMKYCFAPKLNISNSIAQAMLSPENLWITRLILI